MVRRNRPKELSEQEIKRILLEARQLVDTINSADIYVGSDHYRAIDDLRDAIFVAAKAITGSDRPWPVFTTTGPY